MFAIVVTMGLVEWIIDDTCLVIIPFANIMLTTAIHDDVRNVFLFFHFEFQIE